MTCLAAVFSSTPTHWGRAGASLHSASLHAKLIGRFNNFHIAFVNWVHYNNCYYLGYMNLQTVTYEPTEFELNMHVTSRLSLIYMGLALIHLRLC